jgi:hypothetical protein
MSTKLLSQNAKMRKSSELAGVSLWNFGIPAFQSNTGLKTCPMATACVSGCYARQGAYIWDNVSQAYETRLKLTQSGHFIPLMVKQIETKLKTAKRRGLELVIRVHDSGDFYSDVYQQIWYCIAAKMPEVQFYAYTKMISQSKRLDTIGLRPSNFKLIYSFGGKEDSLIDTAVDAHALVFPTEVELAANDYVDVSQNDMLVFTTNKIGLTYHGVKGYSKTTWDKVDASQSKNKAA